MSFFRKAHTEQIHYSVLSWPGFLADYCFSLHVINLSELGWRREGEEKKWAPVSRRLSASERRRNIQTDKVSGRFFMHRLSQGGKSGLQEFRGKTEFIPIWLLGGEEIKSTDKHKTPSDNHAANFYRTSFSSVFKCLNWNAKTVCSTTGHDINGDHNWTAFPQDPSDYSRDAAGQWWPAGAVETRRDGPPNNRSLVRSWL